MGHLYWVEQSDWDTVGFNVCSGYCPVGRTSVRLMSIRHLSKGCCPLGLLSSWFTVRSGYYAQDNFYRSVVYWGCVLGELFVGLVSGRATVRILFERAKNWSEDSWLANIEYVSFLLTLCLKWNSYDTHVFNRSSPKYFSKYFSNALYL